MSLIFPYYDTKTYSILRELKSNSQDSIWEFINEHQKALDQRSEPEPGEVDDFGNLVINEPMVYPETMAKIMETQDRFYDAKDPTYLMWELVDIGVFGFIFLAASDNLKRFINKFFDGHMNRTEHEEYKFEEVII